ncbi:hypothetical protein BDB01DRAFT_772157 [Pilobolus umbonatus]|nr:hypothetical protein BDB01DRAFT_772157 [Pilobolus umbonatus]
MNCHYCRSDELILSLRQELNTRNHQLQRLELDLQTLNQKYVAEIERVSNIQHEKDMVEQELEELSRKLFEEANAMVAAEKRARWQMETKLGQAQEQLLAEQTQLHELRRRLLTEEADDAELNKKRQLYESGNDYETSLSRHASTKNNHGIQQESQSASIIGLPIYRINDQYHFMKSIDETPLETFKEFTVLASTQGHPVKKLNQTPFMKYCLHEDIEPCLRFGPDSKLSVKKLIDYLSRQACFIERIAEGEYITTNSQINKPIWERFSSRPIIIANSCSACGRSADPTHYPLNYRFRLDESDVWLPIDQYCRDRLVAVCEFFVFIRNIQMTLYSDRTIEDLYIENIRLRLQMFYSRYVYSIIIVDIIH